MFTRSFKLGFPTAAVAAMALSMSILAPASAKEASALQGVSVGPQYDTTHVYVAPADFDSFVNSFTATFGGKPSKRGTTNVLPVPSNADLQYVWTPAGTLSTFGFLTPIPYPFGQERTGYLVTDMDEAIKQARDAGAEVIVDKFKDPIGLDTVIQWPGGVKMQLYWHFTAPHYDPLQTVPDNRVYVSADEADRFVKDFLRFSHGKVVSDDRKADAVEIGKAGQTYRRIRIVSGFGKMQVNVTDGHLPYPYGHEISGYEVSDLDATLAKATAAGAKILVPRYEAADRSAAMVQFPGGYIAEIHASKTH
ncbi:glyoxalase [Dyella choica]|uniref:Glyoxalase n=1 Tax=Dyella choica TaxID=1927959 RepID=A0A3S0RIQ1_9GAMM|nr:glyoxalase [Dyella choica]RUL72462.1 glyoxalase [Dyella choica]